MTAAKGRLPPARPSGHATAAETSPDREDLDPGHHDYPVPVRLAEYLKEHWDLDRGPRPELAPAAAYCAKRRRELSARFPGERLVLPSGRHARRANDQDFRFRASSDYVYFSGDQSPEAVLVFEPTREGHDPVLFARGRSDRADPAFFADRRYGEVWTGPRPPLEDISARLDIECHHLADLGGALGRGATSARVLRGFDHVVDAQVAAEDPYDDDELRAVCSELRLVKDDLELAEIAAAIATTTRGFQDVVRSLGAARARGERLVEVVFELRARLEGHGVGYNTIAACGAHATTLHWNANDGPVRDGDLLLLDAGAETSGCYTADITRTFPVSGRFSPAQREVYELVYAAQEAGMSAVRPGARFRDFHRAAMEVLASGLAQWGLLPVSAEESLEPECGLHRRYTLCAPGHMLGLDVHDCAQARARTYLDGTLRPGHVLTVEPGLYFQADDLTVPAELRGIGVRIEDDVVVTELGCELLSSALPRQADQVEAWMGKLIAAGKGRAASVTVPI